MSCVLVLRGLLELAAQSPFAEFAVPLSKPHILAIRVPRSCPSDWSLGEWRHQLLCLRWAYSLGCLPCPTIYVQLEDTSFFRPGIFAGLYSHWLDPRIGLLFFLCAATVPSPLGPANYFSLRHPQAFSVVPFLAISASNWIFLSAKVALTNWAHERAWVAFYVPRQK